MTSFSVLREVAQAGGFRQLRDDSSLQRRFFMLRVDSKKQLRFFPESHLVSRTRLNLIMLTPI
jgi:hypothetical protein